jgi:hypothetical protein
LHEETGLWSDLADLLASIILWWDPAIDWFLFISSSWTNSSGSCFI